MTQDRTSPPDDDPTSVYRPEGAGGTEAVPLGKPDRASDGADRSAPDAPSTGPTGYDPPAGPQPDTGQQYPPTGYGQQPHPQQPYPQQPYPQQPYPQQPYPQQPYDQYPTQYDPQAGYGQQYPPGGYGQPGAYPAYPGYPPAAAPTNTMAILALIFAFVFPPLGIVFGFVGRSQIRQTGESGEGLALAGLIVGSLFTLLIVVYLIFVIVLFSSVINSIPNIPTR